MQEGDHKVLKLQCPGPCAVGFAFVRRPTAARRQALVTTANYVLTCLQEKVLKGKLCCFSHLLEMVTVV